jgi:hypothetical protein
MEMREEESNSFAIISFQHVSLVLLRDFLHFTFLLLNPQLPHEEGSVHLCGMTRKLPVDWTVKGGIIVLYSIITNQTAFHSERRMEVLFLLELHQILVVINTLVESLTGFPVISPFQERQNIVQGIIRILFRFPTHGHDYD